MHVCSLWVIRFHVGSFTKHDGFWVPIQAISGSARFEMKDAASLSEKLRQLENQKNNWWKGIWKGHAESNCGPTQDRARTFVLGELQRPPISKQFAWERQPGLNLSYTHNCSPWSTWVPASPNSNICSYHDHFHLVMYIWICMCK